MRVAYTVFVSACSWILLGQTALQQDRPPAWSLSFQAVYTDMYIFRGHVYDPESSYQGELSIGMGSWSYTLFHHNASEDLDVGFKEYTHTVGFTTASARVVRTFGYRYYDFSDLHAETQEFFFRVSHQTAWHPTYGIAFDVDRYRGYYMDIALSRPLRLSRRTRLILSLDAGLSYDMEESDSENGIVVGDGFFGEDGFNHGAASLVFQWFVTRRISTETGYEYHRAFDDALKEDPATGEENHIWRFQIRITMP